MVYEILATTPFGKEKKGEVGIERMVEEGAYSAAFPLHDVSLFLLHKKYKKITKTKFICLLTRIKWITILLDELLIKIFVLNPIFITH